MEQIGSTMVLVGGFNLTLSNEEQQARAKSLAQKDPSKYAFSSHHPTSGRAVPTFCFRSSHAEGDAIVAWIQTGEGQEPV